MTTLDLPVRGHPDEYDLDTIALAARPVENDLPLPVSHFTGIAYVPRQSRGIEPKRGPWWWCLCCNRCLAHKQSPFCEVHRAKYNQQRASRRYRDRAGVIRVNIEDVEAIRRSRDGVIRAKSNALTVGRQHDPKALSAARVTLNSAIDELSTLIDRYLTP